MNKFWYIILTLIVAAFIGLAIYLFPNLMVYKHNVSDIVDSSYDEIWLVDESAYEFCKSDSTLNETFLPDIFDSMSDWQSIFQKFYFVIDSPKVYWIFNVDVDLNKSKFIKYLDPIGFKKINKFQFVNSTNEIIDIQFYPLVLLATNKNNLPASKGSIDYVENHFRVNSNFKLHLAINPDNFKKLNAKWDKWGINFITEIYDTTYYFDIDKQNDLWFFYQIFPKQKTKFNPSKDFFNSSIIPSQIDQFFTIYKPKDKTLSDALSYHLSNINNNLFSNGEFSDLVDNYILIGIINDYPILIMQCRDTANIINFLNTHLDLVDKNLWKSNDNIFNNINQSHSFSYFYLKDTLLYYFDELSLLVSLSQSLFPFIQREAYKNISLYISSRLSELAFLKNFASPFSLIKEKFGNLWILNSADINSQRLFIWDEKSYEDHKVDVLNLFNKICKSCSDFKLVYSPTNLYVTYIQGNSFFIEGLIKSSFVEIDLPDDNIIDVLIMNDNSENLLLVSNNGLFMYDMAGTLKWKRENKILGYALFKYDDGLQRLFYLSIDGILYNNNSNGETPEGWKTIKASMNAKVAYAIWDSKEFICVADKNVLTLYNRKGERQAQYKFNNSLKDLYFSKKQSILYLIDADGKLFNLQKPKQGSIIGKNTGYNNCTFIGDTLIMWNKSIVAWIDKDNGKTVKDFKYKGTIVPKENKLSWIKKNAPIIIKMSDENFIILSARMQVLDNLSHIKYVDALYWDSSLVLLFSKDDKIEIIKR